MTLQAQFRVLWADAQLDPVLAFLLPIFCTVGWCVIATYLACLCCAAYWEAFHVAGTLEAARIVVAVFVSVVLIVNSFRTPRSWPFQALMRCL